MTPLPVMTRINLGLIGGLLPTLLTLTQIDLDGVLRQVDAVATASWFIRTVVVIGLGGLIAYLYDDETKRLRLVVAGVSAPAIIAAMIAGSSKQSLPKPPPPVTIGAIPYERVTWNTWPGQDFVVLAQARAYANDGSFCYSPPTFGQRIQAGITGKGEQQRIWITSRGSFNDRAQAEAAAKRIKQQLPSASLLPDPTIAKLPVAPGGYVLVYANGTPFSALPDNLKQFASGYSGVMAPWRPGSPIILYDDDYMKQLVNEKAVAICP